MVPTPVGIGYTAGHPPPSEERKLAFVKLPVPALVVLLLTTGCVTTPPTEEAPAAQQPPPEITLHLPQAQTCECTPEETLDYTFLEKGFASLAGGEHAEALEYFQRYRRLESSAAADWEADIAIAFTHSLGDGSEYDPDEARKAFRDLRKADWQAMDLHQQTLLMRQSLETFLQMERESRELERTIRTLRSDLEKREEALKRLRELTLGQTGSTP